MGFMRRVFRTPSVAGLAVFSFLMFGRATAQDMGTAKFVDVDGIRTRYFDAGTGENLVLIHGGGIDQGGGGAKAAWSEIFSGLAQHFHVYAFDKLGMGETDLPKGEADYTIDATIKHAYDFMRKLGIQSTNLAGQSRGALPAARIAVDHPEMVKNLILFDSATFAPEDPSTPIDYYVKQEALHPRAYTPKEEKGREIMRKLQSQYIERNREKVKNDPQLGISTSPSPFWIADTKLETHKLIKEGRLKAPTLIIWGYNDPSAPVILASRVMNLIFPVVPQAELYIFNEAKHHPWSDHPQETIKLIVDFIKNPS